MLEELCLRPGERRQEIGGEKNGILRVFHGLLLRGLGERAINFGHALKNTLVPVITVVGLQLGMLIAFSLVTETVFQWPGVGLLFIESVTVADIPVMSAYLLLIAVLFVTINLVVDMLYFAVDPRLRSSDARGAR